MMTVSHMLEITTRVDCLLVTESLRLGKLQDLLTCKVRYSANWETPRVLLTFILELKEIVLLTIERQTFRFPVKSQLMFDIYIFAELIVQYHRHKPTIHYFRW